MAKLEPRPARAPRWRAAGLALVALQSAASAQIQDVLVPRPKWWEAIGPGTELPASDADASRFLHQATFGPVADDIIGLNFAGFDGWFEFQRRVPATRQAPRLVALANTGATVAQGHRQEQWWHAAVRGDDQLRQRMAFALSEIFVVSDRAGSLDNQVIPLAVYYDRLAARSLGSFRTLLEEVTKSPVMGRYLSHLRNQKGDPANNIRPDENYAREIMQLFTIGLIELNADGTPRLDVGGSEIPTYTQADIEELSRVMTGWSYAGSDDFLDGPANMTESMVAFPAYHDDGAKVLPNGSVIPAGLSPEDDLDAALDFLFNHPNTPPFISLQLIQRLVTSNPTPAYVERVARVFEDNGTGVRGDLFAVARAILMDDEARSGPVTAPNTFGKVREPLVRMAGLWRHFKAHSDTGVIRYWHPEDDFGQAALRAPSVFNFFLPDHVPPGPVADAGLVSPELQIATHTLITASANEFRQRLFWAFPGYPHANANTMRLDLSTELALSHDPAALVDHLDLFLMAGQMSAQMRDALVTHVTATAMDAGNKPTGTQRVLDATYLIITSPEGSMQR